MKKLIMMALLMPLMASAYETWTDSSTGIQWTYAVQTDGTVSLGSGSSLTPAVSKSTTGDLAVPSSVNGRAVTGIGDYAFYDCSALTSVAIPPGVTSIGDYAFFHCRGLASVTIPAGVTRLGISAFSGCSALTSVTIPSSVTDIGSSAFSYCRVLTSVAIPEGVTSIGDSAFSGCLGLASVTIPSSVTSIGNSAFYNCSALTSVTIPSGVTGIGERAFLYCIALTAVTIPSGVTGIGDSAFEGCYALKVIHVGRSGDIDAVKQMLAKSGFDADGVEFDCVDEPRAGIRVFTGWTVRIETRRGGWTAKGLPKGLKFNKKSGQITGVPTGAAGDVVVTFTKKGETPVEIVISVAAISDNAVGKFNGFVFDADGNRGTLQLTTTEAGKLTAKVVMAKGSVSFSGTGWDDVSDDGIYSVTLTTKKGYVLALNLDSTAAWDANQLTGTFSSGGSELSVSAQRNGFSKTWYFNATGDESSGWMLSFAPNAKSAALTVALKADGSTSIAGKLPNGVDGKGKAATLKVSASGYANVGGLREGAILADFAPIVKVGGVKKALSITANLWFDRKNDHAEGAGSAKFVE